MEFAIEFEVRHDKGRQYRVMLSEVGARLLEAVFSLSLPVECIDENNRLVAITFLDKLDLKNNRIYLRASADCKKLRIRLPLSQARAQA